MGMLDIFKKKPAEPFPTQGAEAGGTAISGISQLEGPPGFKQPGMGAPGAPPAMPMFPQSQPIPASSPFERSPFSPSGEMMEVQRSASTQAVSADDLGKRIGHLEDKMEIMNEKLDLILRELRNIYEQGAARRI